LYVIDEFPSIAQSVVYNSISFKKKPKNVFSFEKNWAYPSNVVKDSNGKFSKTEDGVIAAQDTIHLYFTADCKTNVQGGYNIRYCYATQKSGDITLSFSDGLPAYTSEFNIFILGNKFYFKPKIIYPNLNVGQKISYKVNQSALTLYKKNYKAVKMISGYINAEFTETVSDGGKSAKINKYYFRGYFKTPIKA
jgi:hypothetical protein